jgi:transcriptional regulator with XRE-family HTH domain
MTPAQCRAARALLDWSQLKLGNIAKVGRASLAEFEAGRRIPNGRALRDMQTALEGAGVEFIDDVGVKFRKSGK